MRFGIFRAILLFAVLATGGRVMAADLDGLKHYPLGAAIRLEANRTVVYLIQDSRPIEQIRAALDARPKNIRTSLLLGALAEEIWIAGANGLSVYFLASPRGALAPEIADALNRAGMPERSAILQQAIRAVAEVYPDGVPALFSEIARPSDGSLTALGERLKVLGKQFGRFESFEQRIEAFVQSRPDALAHFENVRMTTGTAARLLWMDSEFLRQADKLLPNEDAPGTLDALPKPYRHLFVTMLFEAETLNGGLDQFLTNSSGALAPSVVEAFDDMGLPEHAAALQRVVDFFGVPYPLDSGLRFDLSESLGGYEDLIEQVTPILDPGNSTNVDARLAYAIAQDILPR